MNGTWCHLRLLNEPRLLLLLPIMDGVYEVDDYVILLDPDAIKVFANCECELLFRLSLLPVSASHSWRLLTDASGQREDEVVVGLGEGGGGVEAILAAVRMKKLAVDGVPLDLYGRQWVVS